MVASSVAGPSVHLEARALRVVFDGGIIALDGVDLEVRTGETVALVGESGSGKTTFLRCVNRMVEPEAGQIHLHGSAIADQASQALRRRIGYVQQDGGLLPHWSVRRNVEMVPWLLGWEEGRRRDRADELLAMVGLSVSDHGERHPRELSGGQRQRVAFARALAADPDLLLLDEPFGALDPLTRGDLHAEFLSWKRRLGKTTVLVTHDLREAILLADRIAVMREGRIHQFAAADELRQRPATDYVRALLDNLERES